MRPFVEGDVPALFEIFRVIVEDGTTLAQPAGTTLDEFVEYWSGRGGEQWIMEVDGRVAGGYTLRANQPGRGSHVATATYVVDPDCRGRGLGRMLGEHSLARARAMGFRAVQFNLVVASNASAVRLWHSLGFETLAVLPGVFEHPGRGYVDAHLMFKRLV